MNTLNVKKLLEFIFDADTSPESANQTYQEQLYAYIDAELNAEDAAAKFPAVKAYLDECLACQEEYQEMKALLLMKRRGALTQPPLEATFDFSYLEATSSKVSLWDRLSQTVAQLSTRLQILIKHGKATFDLPPGLDSLWLAPPALCFRGSEQQVSLVSLPDREANINISVAASAASEGRVSLIIRLDRFDPSFLVARAKVTLTDQQGMMLQGAYTGSDGQVEFADVGVGDYFIIIKYKKREWKVPICLGAEKGG